MWLGGKRNRRADHLVHTLVDEMLPYYETCHNSQELGFDGSNLAQKRRKEIFARTLEIEADSIRTAEDDCYYVQSAMDPSHSYLVRLTTRSCDCPDWPRVRLCKHVTGVAHFFWKTRSICGSGHRICPCPSDHTLRRLCGRFRRCVQQRRFHFGEGNRGFQGISQ